MISVLIVVIEFDHREGTVAVHVWPIYILTGELSRERLLSRLMRKEELKNSAHAHTTWSTRAFMSAKVIIMICILCCGYNLLSLVD